MKQPFPYGTDAIYTPYVKPLLAKASIFANETYQERLTHRLGTALFGDRDHSLPPHLQRLMTCQAMLGIHPVADPSTQCGTEKVAVRVLSFVCMGIQVALATDGTLPDDKTAAGHIQRFITITEGEPHWTDDGLLSRLMTGDFDLSPQMTPNGPGFHLRDSLRTADEHADYRRQLREWLAHPNTGPMFLALRIVFSTLRLRDPDSEQWELGLSYLQSTQSMAGHICTPPDEDAPQPEAEVQH